MIEDTERFIVACLCSRREQALPVEAKQLAQDGQISWKAVVERAREQRCAPLLYSMLQDEDFVPSEIKQRLAEAYQAEALRNTVLLHRLQSLLVKMRQAGIPVLVLKGAALAESVYKNIALRPMSDVDILVQRTELEAALAILGAAGYARHRPEERPGMFAAFENEVMLGNLAAPELSLELHWSLLDSPHYQRVIDESWLWDTAVPFSLNGQEAHMLGPEAQVLHLSAHLLLHHEGTELLWLNDIAEVLHQSQGRFDWRLLIDKALAYDLVLPLKDVLPHLAAVWWAPVPQSALDRLMQIEPTPAERDVFRHLTAPGQPLAQQLWSDFAALPKWSQRLAYMLRKLFPSTAYMRHRYRIKNPGLLPFFYVYRWLLGIQSAWRWQTRSNGLAAEAELKETGRTGIVGSEGRVASQLNTNDESTIKEQV